MTWPYGLGWENNDQLSYPACYFHIVMFLRGCCADVVNKNGRLPAVCNIPPPLPPLPATRIYRGVSELVRHPLDSKIPYGNSLSVSTWPSGNPITVAFHIGNFIDQKAAGRKKLQPR